MELTLREFPAHLLKRRITARTQQHVHRHASQHRSLVMPHPVTALARISQRHPRTVRIRAANVQSKIKTILTPGSLLPQMK